MTKLKRIGRGLINGVMAVGTATATALGLAYFVDIVFVIASVAKELTGDRE